MDEQYAKKLQEIIAHSPKKELLLHAYKEIKLSKRSVSHYIVSVVLAMIIAYFVGFHEDTVSICRELLNMINEILLSFLAIILGAYAIFQALLSKTIVKEILQSNDNKNLLKDSNDSFLNLTMLYVFGIIASFMARAILLVIPEDFLINENVLFSNCLAAFCIFVYGIYCFIIILEMINFAINLYRMFCLYNVVNGLEALDNQYEDED